MPDDDLSDFERSTFSHQGKARAVFRKGGGAAVIVMAEVPGITPKVADFARRVADIGCTSVMPHLFGTPGKDPLAGGRLDSLAYGFSSIVPL
jgi:dienelactone hydrolase